MVHCRLTKSISHPDGTDPEHDPGNTTQEDAIIHNVTASGQFQSTFPCRPAYRTWAGGKVNSNKVWANYFRLNLGKGITIHRYGISVEPDRDGKKPKGKTMKRIVEILLELPEFTDVKQSLVTDFSTLLISPEPINASELPSLNSTIRRTIHYRREGDDLPRQQDRQFHLQIERLSALNTIDLQRPWDSNDLDQTIATQKAEILQCLNIIFGHYIKTHDGLVSVGSQKGYIINQSKQEHELGAGLVALRGFFSSVRIATSQVLLNVNVSNAAFYKAVGLDELMKLYIGVHGSNIEKLEAFLKGLRVTAEHLPEKDRDGHRLSRVKTIFSLAREEDVRFVLKSPDNPSSSGGGSKGKAKQTDTFDPSKVRRDAQGRVGVFDFFRASISAFSAFRFNC